MKVKTNPIHSSTSDTLLTIEQPDTINNFLHKWVGLGIHAINKIRHKFQGYKSARGFSSSEIERAVEYDFGVVKRWLDYLKMYDPAITGLKNRKILELGPGADLGVGLITLAEGASGYFAMDVHNLVQSAPEQLYNQLFKTMLNFGYTQQGVSEMKKQLELWKNHEAQGLQYLCRKDFDLSILKGNDIDLVVSNSAFQQFDNPFETCRQLDKIVRPGGQFVALIDLKTHTRWIKQRDPLNIYRYPNKLYKLLTFRGIQNRWRPFEFKKALEQNGWGKVKIYPRHKLDKSYVDQIIPSLHHGFQAKENDMDCLTVVICATKL